VTGEEKKSAGQFSPQGEGGYKLPTAFLPQFALCDRAKKIKKIPNRSASLAAMLYIAAGTLPSL
jgi:hypothetical protein